jgi:sugar lactone lactonase YvrE
MAASAALLGCGSATDDTEESSLDLTPRQCSALHLPTGSVAAAAFARPFDGSEDFALDGHGNMVGKRGNDIVAANAAGEARPGTVASLPGTTFGLRFHPNGNLIGAMVHDGKLVAVAPNRAVTVLRSALDGPNGVYVDRSGNIWFTEGGANRVSRLAPNGNIEVLASGGNAQGANGIVVDEVAKRLYYTEYDKGRILRVDLTAPNPAPVEVWVIRGAKLDGLTLDGCGNLYAIDLPNQKLFRLRTNARGEGVDLKQLASFPTRVSNMHFGSGPGFDPSSLYVVGSDGHVFKVAAGVTGAPIPKAP